MHTLFRTAAAAVASSATTALLIGACAVDNPSRADQAPTAATQPTSLGATSAPATQSSASPATTRGAAASQVPVRLTTSVASAQGAPGQENPAVQVFRDHGASVVNVTSIAVVRTARGIAEQPQGIGSGFFLDGDGRIVTNNHVVQDANQLAVTLQDKTTIPATLVGRDPDNDLAVIQVDANQTDDSGQPIRTRIQPVTMGDSDRVTIGETTIAMGSPLGLQQTVTEGIVSARRNPGEESAGAPGSLDLLAGAIQTDASINPGNSGGPLFNAGGQVIGVNSAILSQSGGNEGIGFAIPANAVKRVAPELIQSGNYRHPQVGVSSLPLAALSPSAKQQLNIPANQKGLLVIDVAAGARDAGLRAGSRQVTIGGQAVPAGGDIIVAVDGNTVATTGELRGYIENNKHPGDTVVLSVLRDGQRQDVSVALSERPAQEQPTQPAR